MSAQLLVTVPAQDGHPLKGGDPNAGDYIRSASGRCLYVDSEDECKSTSLSGRSGQSPKLGCRFNTVVMKKCPEDVQKKERDSVQRTFGWKIQDTKRRPVSSIGQVKLWGSRNCLSLDFNNRTNGHHLVASYCEKKYWQIWDLDTKSGFPAPIFLYDTLEVNAPKCLRAPHCDDSEPSCDLVIWDCDNSDDQLFFHGSTWPSSPEVV